MQKVINFLLLFFLIAVSSSFNILKKGEVKWLTVEAMQKAYKNNPKPILVDIYTNWCHWCKVMDKETYQNEKVANYINQNYYAIKFNAETKESVKWQGRTFNYNSTYKVNEFAAYLTNGNLGYPTTVLLTAPDAQATTFAGYLKAGQLEPPLKYFGDSAYKTKTYPEFLKTFSVSW
ncbi:thioredoxin family protein [Ferruginibacter sp. SUN002]|uniref:thioredoxin family protein n=1 Tax=Ferruginibacter sp. SUN002 TaxID=2937789 RepID=UPI003D36526B